MVESCEQIPAEIRQEQKFNSPVSFTNQAGSKKAIAAKDVYNGIHVDVKVYFIYSFNV